MTINPDDLLALPFVFLLGIVAVMIMVAAGGGSAAWLGDIATAIVGPLTVLAAFAAIGLSAYQSAT